LDFNIEALGHNKRTDETVMEYIRRVMASDYLSTSEDWALHEFCPTHVKNITPKFDINPNTYYFSIAAGARNRHQMKKREILRDPAKTSKAGSGFDLDA
jgi:hypothetical protein